MSDSTESSRQATHAKQEGVDDNVAALRGAVIDAGGDDAVEADSPPVSTPSRGWSSAVNAAPVAQAGKPGGELSGRWIAAAGMGIGSAALVAALLYSNRGANRGKRDDTPGGSKR